MGAVLPLEPPKGLRVLVTGGARGIGRAIAEAYAAHESRVAILDRDPVPGAPEGWLCRQGSAADAADLDAAFAAADEAWGGVDAVFANAGIAQWGAAVDLPLAEWQRILDINLTGVFLTAQAAARRMLPAKSGLIVLLASIYGLGGGPRVPGYTATKGAVANLARSLGAEWGPHGVRVNAIAPGYIETDMTTHRERGPVLARTPLGRFGRPEEIAGVACFLASPAAGYVNGTVLSVDGGWNGFTGQTL